MVTNSEAYVNRINEIRDHHELKAVEAFVAVGTREILDAADTFEQTGLVTVESASMSRTTRDIYADVFTSFSRYTLEYLLERKAEGEDKEARRRMVLILINFFFSNLQLIVQIMTRTTRLDIIGVVQRGIAEGKSNADIARDIRRRAPSLAKKRAVTRASVTVLQGSSLGSQAGASEAGSKQKMWWTTLDERTRRGERGFNHAMAHKQVVPFNQPFIVSGENLQYPGDTTLGASIGNVAGCRCVPLYVI